MADTGPLRYLVEIGSIEILPRLFGQRFIPTAVHTELQHAHTPEVVRIWASQPPIWLQVFDAAPSSNSVLSTLDEGSVQRSLLLTPLEPSSFFWMIARPSRLRFYWDLKSQERWVF